MCRDRSLTVSSTNGSAEHGTGVDALIAPLYPQKFGWILKNVAPVSGSNHHVEIAQGFIPVQQPADRMLFIKLLT